MSFKAALSVIPETENFKLLLLYKKPNQPIFDDEKGEKRGIINLEQDEKKFFFLSLRCVDYLKVFRVKKVPSSLAIIQ